MSAQFVGAVAFKALMRVTGTIAGALMGIWLVSDYTSTPLIFLPVLFLERVMHFFVDKSVQITYTQAVSLGWQERHTRVAPEGAVIPVTLAMRNGRFAPRI
jgi:hypothetical protein